MLGPLPKVYRVLVCVIGIALFVGLGAWAATFLRLPDVAMVGASIGAGLGVVAVFVMLHDFHLDDGRRSPRVAGRPPRIRARARRHRGPGTDA